MKFATAAAVLIARTIPTADSSSSSFEDVVVVDATTIKTKKEDNVISRHPFTDVTAVSPPWKKFGRGPLAAAERRKLKHQWAEASPLLQGRVLAADEGDLGEECDPSFVDVLGILSCGPGRYCVESSRFVAGDVTEDGIPAGVTSSLGGFCVKDASTNMGVMQRDLQSYGENSTSRIGYLNYICYNRPSENNPYNPYGITCQCNGVDVEAYTGFASCSTKDPFCYEMRGKCEVNSTTLCQYQDFDFNVTGPNEYTLTFCTDPVDPEVLTSCETVTIAGSELPSSCSFQVNGTDCNSCAVVECDYYGTGYMSPSGCQLYDCSNTAMATIMETPGYTYKNLWIVLGGYPRLDKDKDLPCEGGCFLCGENGDVTDGLYVTVPGYGNMSCSYLEKYAISAYFGPAICSSDTYRSQCGCVVVDGDNTPSPMDPPVMPPTEEDDGSAPTDPPAEEDDGSSGASTTAIMTTGLHGLAIAAAAVAAASLN